MTDANEEKKEKTKAVILEKLFIYDGVWEWKLGASENLFIHQITHADMQTLEGDLPKAYMLNYLHDRENENSRDHKVKREMLCLFASENLDEVKSECLKFYMAQHPSES